jgi:hypothetical protein
LGTVTRKFGFVPVIAAGLLVYGPVTTPALCSWNELGTSVGLAVVKANEMFAPASAMLENW